MGDKWHISKGQLPLPHANVATHPQEEIQGSSERHGHTKGYIPLAWGREDEWLGGSVVRRASQIG